MFLSEGSKKEQDENLRFVIFFFHTMESDKFVTSVITNKKKEERKNIRLNVVDEDECFLGLCYQQKQAGCLSFGICRCLHMPGMTEEMKQQHNLILFPRTVQPWLEVEETGM